MIKAYSELDDRAKLLGYAVKHFAKVKMCYQYMFVRMSNSAGIAKVFRINCTSKAIKII